MKGGTKTTRRCPCRKKAGTYLALGAALLGMMGVAWVAQGDQSGNWPVRAWVFFWALIAAGLLYIVAGILATGTTLEERLRALPKTGLKMLLGLGVLAILFGWVKVIHFLFPSLDAAGLKSVATLSVAVVPILLVIGVMLVFTVRSKKIKKRIDRAMRNACDSKETNRGTER
jgi:drug/metabolite transporter (DMT)-like permease